MGSGPSHRWRGPSGLGSGPVVWGSGPSHRWRGPSGWEVAPWFGEVVPATGGVGQVVPSHRWRGPSDAQPQVTWGQAVWEVAPSHRWRGPSGLGSGLVVWVSGPSHRWRGPSGLGSGPWPQVAWAKWCPNSQSPQKGDFGVLALLLVPPPSSVVGCGGGVGGTFSQ